MTTQPQTKKTPVKKNIKKRLLNKLPINLPAYNYESFSYKDIQKAVSYFQTELAKIEKLLGKFPTITIQQESKSVNVPSGNPYVDIYGGQPNISQYGGTQLYNNQVKVSTTKPIASQPDVVALPLPYQPYQPGMQGDHMEMPSILGSSGVVVNTLKDKYEGQPFNGIQAPLPIVEDNSAELEAELKNLINPTN